MVLDSYLRTGKTGSFVDNAGSGGILIHVDPEKGITDSHGLDKKGIIYDSHPNHGYSFSGILLPFWDEALKTVKQAALTIPGVRYAGWDLTFTDENRWIIIEGNATPMYVIPKYIEKEAQGFGNRYDLMETIHYDELIQSEETLCP
jgi:hypothetical protein